MTDKVQKIKDWISKEQEGLMNAQGNFEYPEHEGAYHILCNLDAYIDSMQEEPVSEDLKKCTSKIILEGTNFNKSWYAHPELAFKAGAKWQKQQMIKESVEVRIRYINSDICAFSKEFTKYMDGVRGGSKVKLIIIKEE